MPVQDLPADVLLRNVASDWSNKRLVGTWQIKNTCANANLSINARNRGAKKSGDTNVGDASLTYEFSVECRKQQPARQDQGRAQTQQRQYGPVPFDARAGNIMNLMAGKEAHHIPRGFPASAIRGAAGSPQTAHLNFSTSNGTPGPQEMLADAMDIQHLALPCRRELNNVSCWFGQLCE